MMGTSFSQTFEIICTPPKQITIGDKECNYQANDPSCLIATLEDVRRLPVIADA